MSKPSLTSFMTQAVTPKAEKSAKQHKDVKNITIRPNFAQWEALVGLTTSERTKIQPYVLSLIAADFERRGLRWPD